MTIPYRFAAWSRRGLARAHTNPDTASGPLAVRPRITVGLTLQAKSDGNTATAVSGNVDLTLYGPSDVIGIDPRLIVRTDPRPNVTNFEPNYLAIVDFDPPDFPWLLTPAHADGHDRLRPWLVLIVVERAKVKPPALVGGRPLPSISLKGVDAATELPNLNESWLWAHTQAVSQAARRRSHDALRRTERAPGAEHLAARVPPAPGAAHRLHRLRRPCDRRRTPARARSARRRR